MQDRAEPARPGPSGTGAGGAVRIIGPYPPPPPPGVPTPVDEFDMGALLARPPVVTRYTAPVRPAPGRTRSRAGLGWTVVSAVLAVAGVGAIVVLPQVTSSSARVDVPLASAAADTVPAPAASPAGQVPLSAGPEQLPASKPVGVRIPALGVTSDIMDLGLERDGAMEVPPGAYPVGWYHGSVTPGQQGAAVLAGHVDWQGEPGAFYGLRELVRGDTVEVERTDGSFATFVVDRVEEHPKDAFPTKAVYGEIDHAGLRLITCGGGFDEDTGQYQANVVVFARLVVAAA